MKIFKMDEEVEGLEPCLIIPARVRAKQMQRAFLVEVCEGRYRKGKAGDYLISGDCGRLYVCDKDVFEEEYRFTAC